MSGFINVTKDGEVIGVHPDALADHIRLGWSVVVEPVAEAAAPAPAPKPEEKKKPK